MLQTAAQLNPALASQIAAAASTAGLRVLSAMPETSFAGDPTTVFTFALAAIPENIAAGTAALELSQSFDPTPADLAPQVALFLAEAAARLRAPSPDVMLTINGIPLSYSQFRFPFHSSTAGADTSVVHGLVTLADGTGSPLHAKIAAAITVTFREIVPVTEQPFAESFILNAVRKTFDQGQLELVKSGNRQPVPVTTRYYSPRTQKFVFNDTTAPQRKKFLAAKAFWLSNSQDAALGNRAPVWLQDPRDAQYLNTTVADLKLSIEALVKEGLLTLAPDPAYASPTPALMAQSEAFHIVLAEALAFIKPSFNEDMRAGNTNM